MFVDLKNKLKSITKICGNEPVKIYVNIQDYMVQRIIIAIEVVSFILTQTKTTTCTFIIWIYLL